MENLKKEATDMFRRQMTSDYDEGYKSALEMIKNGKITLQEAEELVTAEEPIHEAFAGQSEKFKEGFIDALKEILKEAKQEE